MSVRVFDRDRGYAQILRNALAMKAAKGVTVGVKDGPHIGSDLSIAEIGAVHEFGLGHVPQRSFLRAWVDQNQRGWRAKLKEFAYRALMGREAWEDNFGKYAVEGVRARMRLGIMPPLLDATVKRKKGGATPLIETEQLIDAIEYRKEG